MPSLFRFLAIVGALVGIAYAAMFALVMLVEPQPREITQMVPPSKMSK